MGIVELAVIAAGVSMDAFAVSVCKGLSVRKPGARHYLSAALWFGGFQAMMPLAGYFLGVRFAGFVSDVDHWIAFVLLGMIGGNMRLCRGRIARKTLIFHSGLCLHLPWLQALTLLP